MRVWWIAFVSTLVGLGAGIGIAAFILLPRISESTRDSASMQLELSENAPSRPPAELVIPEPVAQEPPPVPAVQMVEVEHRGTSPRASGIIPGMVLASERLMLLPLAPLDGVSHVAVVPRGLIRPGAIVGIDAEHGLAAFELASFGRAQGGALDAVDTLFLGREFSVLTPATSLPGQIASVLAQFDDGTFGYRLTTAEPLSAPLAAITDVDSGDLLGVVLAGQLGDAAPRAYDLDVILKLIDPARRAPALPLADLEQAFFAGTPEGQWYRFMRAVNDNQWNSVIAVGKSLLRNAPARRAIVQKRMQTAFLISIRRAMSLAQTATLRALLDAADESLPRSFARDILRADSLRATSDIAGAFELVSYWRERDERSAQFINMQRLLVSQLAARGADDGALLRAALDAIIASDPAHAPFYVIRGDSNHADGRYLDAVADFESAMALDPSLTSSLARRLDRSEQRALTPAAVIVPLNSAGAIFSATVTLNGSTLPFDFIIDTGASISGISSATARSIGLNDLRGARAIRLNTANGWMAAPVVTLTSIDLAGATVRDMRAVVLEELSGYDGLLGLDFLARFDVDINAEAGEIVLIPR